MKKLFSLFIICFLFYCFQQKAVSYDTFSGRYGYSEVGNGNLSLDTSQITTEEILIILDYSSSMKARMNDRSRLNYAISALYSVVDSLPSGTRIGLRIFGPNKTQSTAYDTNRSLNKINCSASHLIAPIQQNNSSNIKDSLSQYTRPEGGSPITFSLKDAIANDFTQSNSFKHIVLITDGKESCPDDPCQYIKKIMQTRNDIRIDVIGISTEENAYSQLSCLANSTNGKYHIVNNVDDLYLSLETAIASVPPNINPPQTNVNEQIAMQPVQMQVEEPKPLREIKYTNYAFEFDI